MKAVTLFEPDVLVASRSGSNIERSVESAPLLVAEVLSPGTRTIDLTAKRMAYAEAGVSSYWIVDPGAPSITLLELDLVAGEYVEVGRADGSAAVSAETPFPLTIVPVQLVRGRA